MNCYELGFYEVLIDVLRDDVVCECDIIFYVDH